MRHFEIITSIGTLHLDAQTEVEAAFIAGTEYGHRATLIRVIDRGESK
jgi:hypothetical protein